MSGIYPNNSLWSGLDLAPDQQWLVRQSGRPAVRRDASGGSPGARCQSGGWSRPWGSSYIAGPDASRCKGLSRTRDGIVIAEADLNLCRQVKDLWCLQMTARHADYAKFLSDYVAPDYKPQVVKDPSLS